MLYDRDPATISQNVESLDLLFLRHSLGIDKRETLVKIQGLLNPKQYEKLD